MLMKLPVALMRLAVFFVASCSIASAALVITFDDVPNGTALNSYQGFNWNNFYIFDTRTLPYSYTLVSGYTHAAISQPNIAYNGGGTPASFSAATTFNLTSASITAGWRNGLNVEVQGWNGSTELYDNNYTVNTAGPSLINFNYLGITSVDFITSGGTDAGFGYSGTQMAIDNITINGASAVPEPSTIISGLGALGFVLTSSLRRLHRSNSVSMGGVRSTGPTACAAFLLGGQCPLSPSLSPRERG